VNGGHWGSAPVRRPPIDCRPAYRCTGAGRGGNNYQGDFRGDFRSDFQVDFQGAFQGDCQGDFQADFQADFQGASEVDFQGDFQVQVRSWVKAAIDSCIEAETEPPSMPVIYRGHLSGNRRGLIRIRAMSGIDGRTSEKTRQMDESVGELSANKPVDEGGGSG
jgi:hypothetical protein